MSDFDQIIANLPDSFDAFYKQVLDLMQLSDLSHEELAPIKSELEIMYSDALFEVAEKVLEPEDRDFIEGFLLTHPGVSRLDVYFAAASEKPNIDQVLKQVLQEILERMEHLKSKLTDEQ